MLSGDPTSVHNRLTAACGVRGYCGPFVNQELYDAVPGWEGIATCRACGNTVAVAPHLERRAALGCRIPEGDGRAIG